MKQLSRLLAVALFALWAQSCIIVTAIYNNTDKKQARIVLNDGSEIEGRTVVPKTGQKRVRVTTSDGQKLKMSSSDIADGDFQTVADEYEPKHEQR